VLGRLALFAALAVLVAGCGAGTVVGPTANGKLVAPPTPPTGNAAAGKLQFTASGCVACHTFTPAGSTATIGPDLDNLAAYAAKAHQSVGAFAAAAIANPPAPYVPPGFPTNTMPKLPLSSIQIANIVAFLTKGP